MLTWLACAHLHFRAIRATSRKTSARFLHTVATMSDTQARYVGDFAAWNGGGLFIGSGGGSIAPHAHYALQVVVGAPRGLKVQSGRRGAWVECAGAIIPSRAVHSIAVDA